VIRHDDEIHRQAERVGLIFNELPPDAVHGHAVIGLADAGDERGDPQVGMVFTDVMEGEGAVFAPAPEKGGILGCVHGMCRRAGQVNRGVPALHTAGCPVSGLSVIDVSAAGVGLYRGGPVWDFHPIPYLNVLIGVAASIENIFGAVDTAIARVCLSRGCIRVRTHGAVQPVY
jgi:hypothetical protein